MDTVEWGSGDPAPKRPGRVRSLAAVTSRRRMAIVLAVLAIAALIGAELLPWATLHTTARADSLGPLALGPAYGTGGDSGRILYQNPSYSSQLVALPGVHSLGLSEISGGSTLVYRFGTMLLLALVGAVLLARPAQRRLASGLGFGVLAAQLVVVVGIIRSFNSTQLPSGTTTTGTGFRQSTIEVANNVASSTIETGTLFAFASLVLLAGALVMSVLPDQVRARLVTGAGGPAEPGFADEPADLTVVPSPSLDLTVSPVTPVDASYFGRPDSDPRQSFSRPDPDAGSAFRRPDRDAG
ncbi:hypothetical protein GCM10023322_42240 [Rugosimonospora acidiphila]|uniref:Uncharacterized protein n=1 Tax=Rugosimonospora acidiphila TaxID=556531 RepID=A0ABP9S0N9_9ACTN